MRISKGRLKIDDGDSRKAKEPRGGPRAPVGTREDISSISERRAR